MKIKKSFGIACIRKKQQIEILLIKKPVTYHYCEFISGHYYKNDDKHILKLFNNMTYYEKMDILTLKFHIMWFRLHRVNPEPNIFQGNYSMCKQYIQKKNKFETTFLHDGGLRLKRLIGNSNNIDTLWEAPKGKKNTGELDIDTAIREFYEETLIEKDKYKLLLHIKPYIETYSDFNITYQSIIYFAEAIGDWEPNISFNNNLQTREVACIKWCALENIKYLGIEKTALNRLIKMFKKIKEKYKNSQKQKIRNIYNKS